MNLHEYQAKKLLAEYGLPAPQGQVAWNVEEVVSVANHLGGSQWIVKAQVHAGGRGKAGGVKFVKNKDELMAVAKSLLGIRLVTHQTDERGQPVNQVFIAEPCDIERELYLGAVVDRKRQRIVFMASTEGGIEIEEVAAKTPEKILQVEVDPLLGVMPFQGRELAFQLGLNEEQIKQFTKILIGLGKMFKELDLSLIEINPLVVDKQGHLTCLDAKIVVDDNALYRHPKLRDMRDPHQEDERENRAHDWELNYIRLEGNNAELGAKKLAGSGLNITPANGLADAARKIVELTGGKR